MPPDVIAGLLAAFLPPVMPAAVSWSFWCLHGTWSRGAFFFGWGAGAAVGVVLYLAAGYPFSAAACALNVLIAAFLWWLSRRRRKRAAKLIGAKSRALLAAVVRTMRERSRPRPVFRPQPGGTHA